MDLQTNLPRLVPPCHLEMITSLELLWSLNTIQAKKDKVPLKDHVTPLWDSSPNFQGQADSPLHILCGMIPLTFPHIRSLYISFQCWLDQGSAIRRPSDDVISEVETIFLGPVDHMLRACLLGRPGQWRRDHGHVGLELDVAT